MYKTLEEQIEERKKQAKDRGISRKASIVASGLGWQDKTRNRWFYQRGNWYIDERKSYDFSTLVESFGRINTRVVIEYQGNVVYEDFNIEASSYVPGKWEKELDELYSKASIAIKEKQKRSRKEARKAEKDEETRIRKKWGL